MRGILLISLTVPLLFASPVQAGDVQLLLMRDADYASRCTSCIPGRLFGVPSNVALESGEWSTWALEPLADTIELGFEDNVPNRSSIPTGTYDATIRTDATKNWMVGSDGRPLINRAWRIELSGERLGKRTAIQFHFGKDVLWSEGCIIVGRNASQVCQDECRFSDSPEDGLKALREYVEERVVSSSDRIRVRIADRPGVPD